MHIKEVKTYLQYWFSGLMTASGSSSRSTSSGESITSRRYFLKPSVTVSTMRGSRMALKISSSPSMATKW
jgi:hypothetical protein